QDLSQIGTFFPGAMSEAAGISLDDVAADLVLVSPNDPGAMLRHTAECRDRGVAFAADPSQTLTFLDGEAIKALVEGAHYLFTNEYEAGLVAQKTGWSDAEILDLVDTRITTHGAKGSVISRKGEPDISVGVVEADVVVDPTGTGDAFRAGFLTGRAWGLDLERAAQLGALLATYVVESVGPQDYSFTTEQLLARFAKAFGDDAAAEIASHS
ncbi:MAG: adoK, partial [Frankiales bacterium]|nr:adoK [Frankiales bacterium]